jgi:hypothetical protein
MDQESGRIEYYIDHINKLSYNKKSEIGTDCNHFEDITRDRLSQIRGNEKLLKDLIAMLIIVGDVGKFLTS